MSKEKLKWHNETRSVRDLVPAEYNPRQMTEKQAKALRKSLEKFDVVDPIAINADNRIISGHQRIRLLADLGIQVVDVRVPNRLLDEMEEKELNIRMNANRGEFDFDALANNFDLDFLKESGMDEKMLDKILGKIDHSEDDEFDAEKEIENIVQPVANKGDVFLLGEHRLFCGDSTDKDAVLGFLNGVKADICFTDPPYGVSYVGKTKDALEIENDKLEDNGELEAFLRLAFANVVEALKPGAAVYVAAPAGPLNQTFAQVLKSFDIWRQTINWVKDAFVMGRSDYHYQHEPIFYGWKPGAKHNWFGSRSESTIWNVPRPKRSVEHPTMKPIALMEKALLNSSQSGDVVFEPFNGSGSTLIACENLGRICYGIEIDPRFVDVTIKRWEEKTGKKALKISVN